MSKLACPCGHIIADQSDNISYKGYILADKRTEVVSEMLFDLIDSLGEANRQKKKEAWIKAHFAVPPYPVNLPDSSMVSDYLSSKLLEQQQYIYQCEQCQRIAIQIGGLNQYQFFLPETAGPRLLFDDADGTSNIID